MEQEVNMTDGMDVRIDLFYWRTRMTHVRRYVADRMISEEEGLGPRAFACLLQLADGLELRPLDAEWLADGDVDALAEWQDGKVILTPLGATIAELADKGEVEAIYALTTMPELLTEQEAKR
jgi:hypothetical protein